MDVLGRTKQDARADEYMDVLGRAKQDARADEYMVKEAFTKHGFVHSRTTLSSAEGCASLPGHSVQRPALTPTWISKLDAVRAAEELTLASLVYAASSATPGRCGTYAWSGHLRARPPGAMNWSLRGKPVPDVA